MRRIAVAVACAVAAAQAPSPWRETAYLKASNAEAGDHFGNGGALEGQGVALSGDGRTLAVGAPYESGDGSGPADNSLYSAGAVYVFVLENGRWSQQAYLKASNPGQSDKFGYAVSLSRDGDTLAVSAYFEAGPDDKLPNSGAVYVFTRSGGRWRQQAYLRASNAGEPDDGDQFGFSISLSGDGATLAVGAIAEDSGATGVNGNQNDNSKPSSGAVYVFARRVDAWTQQAYIKASNTDANDLFGYSVGLSADGNTLAASAFDEDSSARQINGPQDVGRRGSGAIYVFQRVNGTWSQQAFLKASNAEAGDSLGYAVAISADGATIAGGAADEDCTTPGVRPPGPPGCDDDRESDTSIGAAYVFARGAGGAWTQQAFLKASNPGKEDWFGARLALSGDGNTLAVGAQVENGSARTINGPADDAAEDAGAVYVFRRNGTLWSQQAYLKASNADAYDEFGSAMALNADGALLAVGARGESAAGMDPRDNSAPGAGAVYVFERQ
jgi:hypothetical protein